MNEKALEDLIRRVVREEVKDAVEEANNSSIKRACHEIASQITRDLEWTMEHRLVDLVVASASMGVAKATARQIGQLWRDSVLPDVEKTVRETVHPYFEHFNRFFREDRQEGEWWKQDAEGDDSDNSSPPLPRATDLSEAIDYERVRAALREEIELMRNAHSEEFWDRFDYWFSTIKQEFEWIEDLLCSEGSERLELFRTKLTSIKIDPDHEALPF